MIIPKNSVVIAVHTLIIFLLYTSPLWLGWKLILAIIVLNYLQIYLFGGCLLTIKQFKSTEITFQEWLWTKAGLRINRRRFNRFLRWQLPFIILLAALIWQQALGVAPLINL